MSTKKELEQELKAVKQKLAYMEKIAELEADIKHLKAKVKSLSPTSYGWNGVTTGIATFGSSGLKINEDPDAEGITVSA